MYVYANRGLKLKCNPIHPKIIIDGLLIKTQMMSASSTSPPIKKAIKNKHIHINFEEEINHLLTHEANIGRPRLRILTQKIYGPKLQAMFAAPFMYKSLSTSIK